MEYAQGLSGIQDRLGEKLGKTAGHERLSQPSALEEELTPDHDSFHAMPTRELAIFRAVRSP